MKEHIKQKEDLIRQLTKRSNLSKRKIAILIGVSRETVRRVSEEPLLMLSNLVNISTFLYLIFDANKEY